MDGVTEILELLTSWLDPSYWVSFGNGGAWYGFVFYFSCAVGICFVWWARRFVIW